MYSEAREACLGRHREGGVVMALPFSSHTQGTLEDKLRSLPYLLADFSVNVSAPSQRLSLGSMLCATALQALPHCAFTIT